MGSAVKLSTIEASEILPRVIELTGTDASHTVAQTTYGIVVGGDTDGIYGTTGATATTDANRATAGAGQGAVVVTQGRCLARVGGFTNNTATNAPVPTSIAIGDALTAIETGVDTGSMLVKPGGNTLAIEPVVARALQAVDSNDIDIIAVDVQREGAFL